MLSLQDAVGLDIMGSGYGFTPWGPDTCPTLDQLMAAPSQSPSSSAAACGGLAEEEDEEELRRRQRRKASNRLSARRSRARKQQRLDELSGEAARLRAQKLDLAAKLHAMSRLELAERRNNARLRAEAAALAHRYRELRRLAALQRLARQLRSRLPLHPGSGGAALAGPPAFELPSSLMT